MSCFPGRMNEYREISLDRFDAENLQSTAYFLSHKHEDHMQGLSSSSFKYRLETNCHIKFYCSEITRDLLKCDPRYQWIEDFTVVLKIDVPYTLKVPNHVTGKEKYTVNVTPLHAGHCPGSVMFLFEGSEGTALYTGDIRLNRSDLQQFKSLHSSESPKHIDSLYMDTTFCVPEALFIPTRDESAEAALHLIKQWLALSRNHYISLKCSANIGYEHLLIRIAQELNTKIHVSEKKHKDYKNVAAIQDFTTPDPTSTRIHCCTWNKDRPAKSRLPCGYLAENGSEMEVRTLMLSTMWFTQRTNMENVYCARRAPYYYRVCYSFHSSYSELRDMVIYLKPSLVWPNVIPFKEKDFTAVQERLKRFQKLAAQSVPVMSESQPRELGVQRKRKRKVVPSVSSESESMDWGDLSPKKKPKLSQNSTEFAVNYKDINSSQGSRKSTGSERADLQYSSAEEDEESDLDILDGLEDDEDVKLAKVAFTPVLSGSYGDYVSYISDMSDDENGEETKDEKDHMGSDPPGNGSDAKSLTEADNPSESEDKGESGSLKSKETVENSKQTHENLVNNSNGDKGTSSHNGESASEEAQKNDNVIEKDAEKVTKRNDTDPLNDSANETSGGTSGSALENGKVKDTEVAVPPSKVGDTDKFNDMGSTARSKTESGKNEESLDTENMAEKQDKADAEEKLCSKENDVEKVSPMPNDQNARSEAKELVPSSKEADSEDQEATKTNEKERTEKNNVEEQGSSDVEEVGHISANYVEEVDDDVNGPVIDLTEEDEHSDQEVSSSLFSSDGGSSDEDGSIISESEGEYERRRVAARHQYVINSDGELCAVENESDETVEDFDSTAGDSDNEIVISSDEESPQKDPPFKQTARKSTARKPGSVSICGSDASECTNGDSNQGDGSGGVIVLEDSSDGHALINTDIEGASTDDINHAQIEGIENVTDKADSVGDGEKVETETEKILVTSAAFCEKVNTAKEIIKNVEENQSNFEERSNVEAGNCDNTNTGQADQSEEF